MTRHRLLNRRPAETFSFEHENISYVATISRFDDGSISELFLNGGKAGSASDVISRDAAVVLSIARQFSVPLDVITDALAKDDEGNPAGPIGVALKLAEWRLSVVESGHDS